MIHGTKKTTTGGNLKTPTIETYLDWIVESWAYISKEVIKKSFIACGITNALDGKDGDHIHGFKVILD